MTDLLSRDIYFMAIARIAAERSTCPRASVGAVLVYNNRVVATGYNGAAKGMEHCLTGNCVMLNGQCVRSVHAEANTLIQGVQGNMLYVTHLPCVNCMNLIINHGIHSLFYSEEYRMSQEVKDKTSWWGIADPLSYLGTARIQTFKIENGTILRKV